VETSHSEVSYVPYSGKVTVDGLHFHECYSECNSYILLISDPRQN